MKNVCLINGSLRGKQAASFAFLTDVDRSLSDAECRKTVVNVKARLRGGYAKEALASIANADAVVFVFPLYNYGIPGALMRLLEDYYRFVKEGGAHREGTRVYAVVNCGYPRPDVTAEAIRVLRNLCRRLALNWRFAVRIGTGPIVAATKRVPFLDLKLKRAWAEMARDVLGECTEQRADYLIRPVIPEAVIARIKAYYENKGQMIPSKAERPTGGPSVPPSSEHASLRRPT